MKVFAPTDISIITTYRCPMQCKMCNIWKNPTDPRLEIQPEELEILPHVKFINITGGEPFIREDLDKIVEVVFRNPQGCYFHIGVVRGASIGVGEKIPQNRNTYQYRGLISKE